MILCRFSDVQAHTEGPTGTIELLLWIQVLPPRSVAGTEAGVILFAYCLTLKTSLSSAFCRERWVPSWGTGCYKKFEFMTKLSPEGETPLLQLLRNTVFKEDLFMFSVLSAFKVQLNATVIIQIYFFLRGKTGRIFFFFLYLCPPPSYSELFCNNLSSFWKLLVWLTWVLRFDPILHALLPGSSAHMSNSQKKTIIHSLALLLSPSLVWSWGIPLSILVVYSPFY